MYCISSSSRHLQILATYSGALSKVNIALKQQLYLLQCHMHTNISHTLRSSKQSKHCPQIVAGPTVVPHAHKCEQFLMMFIRLVLGLFVLYNLFPRLTAGLRGCAKYLQHLTVIAVSFIPYPIIIDVYRLFKGSSGHHQILHSEKLSREKTFANFTVLWLFEKVFSMKFRGVAFFGSTSKQSVKVFSAKILSTNWREFSPVKVSHYMLFKFLVFSHPITVSPLVLDPLKQLRLRSPRLRTSHSKMKQLPVDHQLNLSLSSRR